MIGDQLEFGDSVCGAVLSIRFGEDILSVWNRNASDNQVHCNSRHATVLQDSGLQSCQGSLLH